MSIWTTIIGAGLQLYAGNKAAAASTSAAEGYNQAVIDAAKPKSVYDPTASAIWDEETQSYILAPSDPMMGLFGANLRDAYRQREMIEGYMSDPESAAKSRFAKTEAAMAPYRQREGQGLLSQLIKDGTATSSMGAEAIAQREMTNNLYDAQRLDAERTGVQSDITNYINRSNMAASNAEKYGSIGQNLANIGTGLGSDAYVAASQGGQGLMNAQSQQGFANAGLPYAIGQQLMGYGKTKQENDLQEQSKYLSNLGYRM